MKLHVPTALRAAILAAFSFAAVVSSSASGEIAPEGYTLTHSNGSNHGFSTSSIWKSYTAKTYPFVVNGTTVNVSSERRVPKYEGMFQVMGTCNGSPSSSHSATFTTFLDVRRQGNGADWTYQCSERDSDGTLTRAGVWYLACADNTTKNVQLSNFNDIDISDCRQQYVTATPVDVAYNPSTKKYTPVYSYTYTDFSTTSPFGGKNSPALKYVGYNFTLTDTNSFTYRDAYTAASGSFTYGAGLATTFENVGTVKFLNNEAASKDVGGITAGVKHKFTITNADTVLFQGNKATKGSIAAVYNNGTDNLGTFRVEQSGDVQFKSNTGTLFRNVNAVFDNIDTLAFNGNKGYISSYYNANGVVQFTDVNDVLFTNNTNKTDSGCLFSASGSGSKASFADCTRVRFNKLTTADALHSSNVALSFRNVKDVAISDNTATSGVLFGTIEPIKGIGNAFSVTGNSATRTSNGVALFSSSVYMHGGEYADGDVYSGTTPKFNIENNSGYGTIQYFTTSGNLTVDDTKSFLFRNNKTFKKLKPTDPAEIATCNLYHVLGKSLTFNRVTSISITGNAFENNALTGLFASDMTASNFSTLTISNNSFSGKSLLASPFHSATLTGRSGGTSTVTISNNKFTAPDGISYHSSFYSAQEAYAATYTAKNLASFKYNNNTYTVGSSVHTMGLGRPVFTNVADIVISSNKTIGEGGISSSELAGAGFSAQANTTLQKASTLTMENNIVRGAKDTALNPYSMVKVAYGGAVYVKDAYYLNLLNNQTVTLTGNSVRGATKAYGGAMFAGYLSAKNNKNVTFSDNVAMSLADGKAKGGAIFLNYKAKTSDITTNDKMVFTNNRAEAYRSQAGHESGGVAQGGAIYMWGPTSIIGAKTLTFTGNQAISSKTAQGGAIYAEKTAITLKGSAVRFRGNYTAAGSFKSLNATSSQGLTLKADGSSGYVRFFDSVENTGPLLINESGVSCGEVLFSGQYAAADLKEIKAKYTAAELAASRSVTGTYAKLNSGKLTFRQTNVDLSSYSNNISLYTAKGSRLGVESSTLNLKRDMEVNGTISFKGKNTLAGRNVTLASGATLEFNLDGSLSATTAKNTLNANLVQGGKLKIVVNGTAPSGSSSYALLKVKSFDTAKWVKSNLTLTGTCVYDLLWKNNILYLTGRGPKEPASTTLTSSMNGQSWLFTNAKSYTVSGTVSPESISVKSAKTITWAGSGSIAGKTSLVKEGTGVLNVNNNNKYTGGTTLKQGTVSAKAASALGTGAVSITGGTLHMNSKALANDINVNATSATIKGGSAYKGKLTLTKGTLSGEKINIVSGKNAYLKTGTVKNALGGSGHVYKQGDGSVTLSGTNNWTGNTYVQGGTLVLSGATTLRGTTRTSAGAKLDVRRAVSMGNLYLGGGTLALKAGNTLTVTGTLTLANATKLALSGVTTSSPVLIKYGKLSNTSGQALAKFFGLSSSYKISSSGGKLTVSVAGSTPTDNPVTPSNPVEPIGPSISGAPAQEVAVDPNALGQSTWGTARAARLFDHTVRDHAQAQSVSLDKNRSVWFAGMSGFSHVDDAADTNIYGGVVGMQFNGTMGGNAGLAIGQTYGRVSPAGASRVKQQTRHAALYGTKMLYTSATDSVSLTGTASYGTTDADHEGYDWTQHSAVIGVRGTWAHKLNNATAAYGFAGLEYLATDSECGSGSIQALQGSIGAGISHTTGRLTVHADASFTPDMVRNAPTTTVSTGRLGFEIGAGATYRLSDQWSINAGYTYHNEKRADSHEAYIGARCTF